MWNTLAIRDFSNSGKKFIFVVLKCDWKCSSVSKIKHSMSSTFKTFHNVPNISNFLNVGYLSTNKCKSIKGFCNRSLITQCQEVSIRYTVLPLGLLRIQCLAQGHFSRVVVHWIYTQVFQLTALLPSFFYSFITAVPTDKAVISPPDKSCFPLNLSRCWRRKLFEEWYDQSCVGGGAFCWAAKCGYPIKSW